tara:strand:+ start:194 stop:373 length:180 start_codon:yes stop_codon:yes gene_type:complete
MGIKRERPAENPPQGVPKPGTKPWPGYPNPMPPGKDWPKLVKKGASNEDQFKKDNNNVV